jgi:hypothetical protein
LCTRSTSDIDTYPTNLSCPPARILYGPLSTTTQNAGVSG